MKPLETFSHVMLQDGRRTGMLEEETPKQQVVRSSLAASVGSRKFVQVARRSGVHLCIGKKLRIALVKKGIGVYVGFKSDTRCVELAWPALRADIA
jgi:hypothetical protein